MIRDNFEKQIGSVLREAEASPPEGSWDFIQSKISGRGFSFPYASMIVSAALVVFSLAVYDSTRDLDSTLQENEKRIAISSEKQDLGDIKAAPAEEFERVTVDYEPEKSPASRNEVSPKPVEINPVTTQPENEDFESDEVSDQSLTDKFVPESKLPVTVSAPMLPQDDIPVSADLSEDSSPLKSETETVDPDVVIMGQSHCYTPCKIELRAGGNAEEYHWDAGIYGKSAAEVLELEFDEASEFTVFLSGRNEAGKEVVTSKVIKVETGSTLYVPNSFSPNGDGFNDDFRVKGSDIESFSMSIINSRGRVVFKTTYMDEPWIYESSQHDLENEKYIAVVRAIGKDGKVHSFNQPLTIIP